MFTIRLSTVPAEPGTGAWPLADGTREGHEAGLSGTTGLAQEDRSPWCPGPWESDAGPVAPGACLQEQKAGHRGAEQQTPTHTADLTEQEKERGLHRC